MSKIDLSAIYDSIKEFNKAYKTMEKNGKDMSKEIVSISAITAKKFVDSMKRLADEISERMVKDGKD